MKNQNEAQTIMSAATKTDRNLIHDVCDVFSLGSQILKFHSLKEITQCLLAVVVDKNTLMGRLKQLGIALLYLLSGYVINHSFTLNGIVSTVWPGSGLVVAWH